MPKRGVVRFGKRGKLSPRFIRPFEILDSLGTIAYRLALPPRMSGVHKVFHFSMLRRYTPGIGCRKTTCDVTKVTYNMYSCDTCYMSLERMEMDGRDSAKCQKSKT